MNINDIPSDKRGADIAITAAFNELQELLEECYTNAYGEIGQVRASIVERLGTLAAMNYELEAKMDHITSRGE